MDTTRSNPTPEQARDQLRISDSRALTSLRDRRIHAVSTAVFGLTSGFYIASVNLVTGFGYAAAAGVFMAVWLVLGMWVERAARTVPRRARRWSRLGLAASMVLALCLVLPWLNLQAQTAPNTWPMVSLAALVVAVPSLVAAAVIARAHR